jgi:hypothetical protein
MEQSDPAEPMADVARVSMKNQERVLRSGPRDEPSVQPHPIFGDDFQVLVLEAK